VRTFVRVVDDDDDDDDEQRKRMGGKRITIRVRSFKAAYAMRITPAHFAGLLIFSLRRE
jgi:hypothetical protein